MKTEWTLQGRALKPEEFFAELAARFSALLEKEEILEEEVIIDARILTPEEAIGITKRKDFPIITGKEVMIQARCMNGLGQAFTDAPSAFKGTLKEICALDIAADSHNRGLFIAALNAVMNHLGLVECTVHCRNDGPERCGADAAAYINERYQRPEKELKIGLVGYQPSLLAALSESFCLRAIDLNPVNIGQCRSGVLIEDGSSPEVTESVCQWADLVLCTGSTVCNGSIVDFLGLGDKVLFYGTTLAGAAELLGLPRLCFAEGYMV